MGVKTWLIVALMVAALTAAATPRAVATAIVPLVALVATGCGIVVVSTTVDDTSNKPLRQGFPPASPNVPGVF